MMQDPRRERGPLGVGGAVPADAGRVEDLREDVRGQAAEALVRAGLTFGFPGDEEFGVRVAEPDVVPSTIRVLVEL